MISDRFTTKHPAHNAIAILLLLTTAEFIADVFSRMLS